MLAQLRTGMARLNAYLHRIKWQRQISAHVGKRERQWSISSSDAEGGRPANRDAAMYGHTKRQHFLPPWREITGR